MCFMVIYGIYGDRIFQPISFIFSILVSCSRIAQNEVLIARFKNHLNLFVADFIMIFMM